MSSPADLPESADVELSPEKRWFASEDWLAVWFGGAILAFGLLATVLNRAPNSVEVRQKISQLSTELRALETTTAAGDESHTKAVAAKEKELEEATAKLYQNSDPKHNGDYVVITPVDTSYVSASGVPSMSPVPTHPCDVFVAVSGSKQGLHLFGEESTNVQAKESSGKITFVKDLL